MLSFPQIVVGDDVLGGFRELIMADQSGRLEELRRLTPRGRGWQRSHAYVPRPGRDELHDLAPAAQTGLAFTQVHEELVLKAAAHPVGMTEVVDRRPARRKARRERVLDRAGERVALPRSELADGPQRMDPRAEQRLVRVDVAHPGDPPLVEQERLDRRAPASRERAQRRPSKLPFSGSTPTRSAKNAARAASPIASSPVPKRRGSQKSSSCPSSSAKRTRW